MFVYADNAATTQIAPQVLDAMLPYLKEQYGNPSTLYRLGRDAKIAIEKARAQVAEVIGAKAEEIFFTGSGTESDNMALKGVLYGPAGKGKKHLITTKIEHHARAAHGHGPGKRRFPGRHFWKWTKTAR